MYEWKDSYKNDYVTDVLIKGLLNLLNAGVPYTDTDGRLVGHINSIDGSMDLIKVISDLYLESDECEYKRVTVFYLDSIVFYCFIINGKIKIKIFEEGNWIKTVSRYGEQEE